MAYASHAVDCARAPRAPRTHFVRFERLVTLVGACALGALIGFGIAIIIGRYDAWALFLAAAIVLAVALYPAAANMADAGERSSPGCKLAAKVHLAALLAWPFVIHVGGPVFWLVPLAALSSLVLLASCWSGSARLVYRVGIQGVIVAALAAHQGTMVVMGA